MSLSERESNPAPADDGPPDVWLWELMPPAQRRHRLRSMSSWVSWLRATYTLDSSIPGCWYAHPLALQHLTALHSAWLETYFGDQTHRALALIDWHDALWRTVDRIHRHTPSACLDGQHAETHSPPRTSEEAEDQHTAFVTGAWGTATPRNLATLHLPAEPELSAITSDALGSIP